MTAAAARAKLPPAGTSRFDLAYAEGGTTVATLMMEPYGASVVCHRHSTSGSVAPSVQLDFTTSLRVHTDDDVVVGPFVVTATVRGMDIGRVEVSWGASAEASSLLGKLKPSLSEPGYDGHAFSFVAERRAGGEGTLQRILFSEINYMREPYSQVGKLVATLLPK